MIYMTTGVLLLQSIGWLYVCLVPHTKVEESFNLHAIHDILFHGASLQNYDHFVFPGVVPRSFVGSLALSIVTAPIILLVQWLNVLRSKFELQILVRLILSTINAAGLLRLHRVAQVRWGSLTGMMFLLVTCTQFHLLFWMGRTLPNMFALYPVNIASSLILTKVTTPETSRKNYNVAISLLIFATVVLRAELILLIGPLVLQSLITRKTSLPGVIRTGLKAGFLSLALTVFVDSYLWRGLLWPELAGQYFNVYQGKSAEWGVSPFYVYFTTHLPKLLLTGLPLAILGLIVDSEARSLSIPYFAFILLLSFHGHKEWRFIIYVIPIWNIVAARGAAWLYSIPARSVLKKVFRLILLGFFAFNILVTVFLLQVSMANYPGGQALNRFNKAVESIDPATHEVVVVHIDNLAAQTGATLFLQEYAPPYFGGRGSSSSQPQVIYNRTENLLTEQDFEDFDWLITERPSLFLERSSNNWKLWDVIDGLEGVELKPFETLRLLRIPRIVQKPKLWLLTKQGH